ncbi:MAG: OpgC domain-containing protein [Planctomycetota bacterium]
MPARLRYQAEGRRDARLDWIRGYAVLAMSVNHFGLDASAFHPFTGGSAFLINAAEVFFFVSGLTLGVVSSRRAVADAIGRCYRRAGEIWVAVLILAAGAVLYGGSGRFLDEPFRFLGAVLTLQEAPNWGDVLVSYVLYMLVVPIAIVMLSGARTLLAIGALVSVYALSQLDPEGLGLPFSSFRNPAANAPLFFGGLLIGWHRDAVSAWWGARRWSALVDASVVAVGIAGLAFYIFGRDAFTWGDAALERFDFGRREYRMPPECLAVVFVYLRCIWLLVDRLWLVLDRALGWLTRWVGRSAMTAYVAHAMTIPVAWWIVGASSIDLDAGMLVGATAITTLYLACVLALVAACRIVMHLARKAPARFGLTHLVGPATACLLLVGGVVIDASGWRSPETDERYEEDWADELEREVYEVFSGFDNERGALLVRVWWMDESDRDGAYDGLAEIASEVIADELDAEPGQVRLLADVPATGDALRARGFGDDDDAPRIAIFEMEGEELQDDGAYERVKGDITRLRADPEDALVLLVVRLEEE